MGLSRTSGIRGFKRVSGTAIKMIQDRMGHLLWRFSFVQTSQVICGMNAYCPTLGLFQNVYWALQFNGEILPITG